MDLHQMRLAQTKGMTDCSEPEFMHHLEHNTKRAEAEAERQFLIDAVRMLRRFACEQGATDSA